MTLETDPVTATHRVRSINASPGAHRVLCVCGWESGDLEAIQVARAWSAHLAAAADAAAD